METTNIEEKGEEARKDLVHFILSHSYLAYFLAIIVGVFLDTIFPIKVFHYQNYQYVGLVIIILSTLLIIWAKRTSRWSSEEKKANRRFDFHRGPYKFSRSPTHLGLSMTTLGFGLMIGSFFVFLLMVIVMIFTKMVFLKKEELLLEKKYGQAYYDYKQKVKTWL